MKAVVFHDIGDIRLEDVAEPRLQEPTDAIVRLTASAICGTDLHFVRGSVGGMRPGTILGHEGVGIVEALGDEVRNLQVGDRVVIPSTIACGNCVYCRAGYYAQCDVANPGGGQADDLRRASQDAPAKATARDLYCYFDNDVKVRAPYDARRLLQLLELDGGLRTVPGQLPDDLRESAA
ncbi:alcohol dehydrogenase catalytic domain-containing protein [Pseudomonas aeruginosa]